MHAAARRDRCGYMMAAAGVLLRPDSCFYYALAVFSLNDATDCLMSLWMAFLPSSADRVIKPPR